MPVRTTFPTPYGAIEIGDGGSQPRLVSGPGPLEANPPEVRTFDPENTDAAHGLR